MTAYASNDGVRIAYEEIGAGEPLVFIHLLAYDRRGWGPLPHVLARDFRVVLVDNRGVGDSDVPEGPYTMEQLAADAVAVLDETGIQSAHVFGVSLGGFIAPAISAATLVIHALADTVIDACNGDLLAERIPGARIERVPDRGHLVMWQEGERLAPIVRDFLRG